MPARDFCHDAVVKALTADGWTITDDPLRLVYGGEKMYVDFGAERNTVAAEKGGEKIAVEIKSFLSRSVMQDVEDALGQFRLYLIVMAETEPERILYLAIPHRVYEGFFCERLGQLILKKEDQLRLIVFDEEQERIVTWITK
jgi:XisH protein